MVDQPNKTSISSLASATGYRHIGYAYFRWERSSTWTDRRHIRVKSQSTIATELQSGEAETVMEVLHIRAGGQGTCLEFAQHDNRSVCLL